MYRLLLLCMLGTFTFFKVLAQQYNFKTYNVPDGLVYSEVSSICEDKNGFIWFGSFYGGISRFDGVTFNNYTSKNGLPSNRIKTIYSDIDGVIWIGTDDAGLVRYDGREFVTYDMTKGLLSNTICAVVNDADGRLWIGTSKGVNIYENGKITLFEKNDELVGTAIKSMAKTKSNSIWIGTTTGISIYRRDGSLDSLATPMGLISEDVRVIKQDSKDNVWIGTSEGVHRITNDKDHDFIQPDREGNNQVMSIEEGHDGKMWVGTLRGGVYVYDGDRVIRITEKNGLNSNTVMSISKSKAGVLWIGTGGSGVSKYIGDSFVHFGENEGLTQDLVFSIIEDYRGNIWLGTEGGGINKLDPKNNRVVNYGGQHRLSGHDVYTIMESSEREIWVGTTNCLGVLVSGEFVEHQRYNGLQIWSLCEDENGNTWIGTNSGAIKEGDLRGSLYTSSASGDKSTDQDSDKSDKSKHFSAIDGFTDSKVRTIDRGKNGSLWFGTEEGIFKYEHNVFKKYGIAQGLHSNLILSSAIDNRSEVAWFGTEKGLVAIIEDKVRIYTEEDGLISNTINSIIIDEGAVWVGGPKSINKVQFSKDYNVVSVQSYAEQEGYTSIETNDNGSIRDSKGNLWFGTIKGVTKINPENLNKKVFNTAIHITKVKLFFEDIDWLDYTQEVTEWFNLPIRLELAHEKNQLTFDFIGINMRIPGKIRYQWKLEGFDKGWSPITYKREANYTNIPPGYYTFKVKASNEAGMWSRVPASFSFRVLPPFWQTWWFILVVLVVFIAFVRLFIAFRLSNMKKLADVQRQRIEIERKMVDSERKALRAQINPHFIFNVLNSIQFYIQDNEPLIASRHLSKFAKLMRMILENSRSSAVPLFNELEALKLYMDLEILRTEYKFDYIMNVADDIDMNDCKIPPMLIQPFVENSIRHGVVPIKGKGRIKLYLKLMGDILMCTIEDNGVGINTAQKKSQDTSHVSSGMQITKDRLEILNAKNNYQISLNVTDLEEVGEQGTRIEVFIPLED